MRLASQAASTHGGKGSAPPTPLRDDSALAMETAQSLSQLSPLSAFYAVAMEPLPDSPRSDASSESLLSSDAGDEAACEPPLPPRGDTSRARASRRSAARAGCCGAARYACAGHAGVSVGSCLLSAVHLARPGRQYLR